MDIQETIDSLRKVLEGVIAPGVETLRLRLDAVEKELHEHGQSLTRLDSRVDHLSDRVDHLAGRLDDGFARVDARMDDGFSRLDARIDSLSAGMNAMGSGLNARLDALTSAILAMRQPTYPDAVLTRLEKLERDIEALRRTG